MCCSVDFVRLREPFFGSFVFFSDARGMGFLNETGLGDGDVRVGSEAHPCAALPKRRVHAAFALSFFCFIKKTRAPC